MARRFEYAASLDRKGRIRVGDGTPLEPGEEWSYCFVDDAAFIARAE